MLASIDAFAPDPEALRAAAFNAAFQPAGQHYPGVRAPLPPDYMRHQLPIVTKVLHEVFGRTGPVRLIDASFSLVTTAPADLSVGQRLPHCDAFDPGRFALVHYLSENPDGTAFFRHRSTGYETINEDRRSEYLGRLETELANGGEPAPGYVAGDTPLFDRIASVEGRYNRAVVYPSFLLHSGAISAGAVLSPDPKAGRLTVTAFFAA